MNLTSYEYQFNPYFLKVNFLLSVKTTLSPPPFYFFSNPASIPQPTINSTILKIKMCLKMADFSKKHLKTQQNQLILPII